MLLSVRGLQKQGIGRWVGEVPLRFSAAHGHSAYLGVSGAEGGRPDAALLHRDRRICCKAE